MSGDLVMDRMSLRESIEEIGKEFRKTNEFLSNEFRKDLGLIERK